MQTKRLNACEDLDEICRLLVAGECVALPTETVYGLAADARSPDALAKIFQAKGRPTSHPLIVHIADVKQLTLWATDIPDTVLTLAEAFWPGPLSILLKRHPQVPSAVTGGRDTVVIRIPEHPVFQRILKHCGLGLAAPSANRYQFTSPTSASHVLRSLDGRIAAVVDGGTCGYGLESTIVDVTGTDIHILRPGPISAQQISSVLQRTTSIRQANLPIPGGDKKHYQPNVPVYSITTTELKNLAIKDSVIGVICYSDLTRCISNTNIIQLSNDPHRYGQHLYAALHTLDQQKNRCILIEDTPKTAHWAAVNDRLYRCISAQFSTEVSSYVLNQHGNTL